MHTEATDHLIIHAYNKDEIRRSMLSPETRQGLAESGTLERDLSLGRAAARDFAIYRTLDKMIIYERRIESGMYKTITKLKQLQVIRRIERETVAEKQTATQMSPPADRNGRAKKQTQLRQDLMDAMSFQKPTYDESARSGAGENKANQSQSPGNADASGQGAIPLGEGFADPLQ